MTVFFIVLGLLIALFVVLVLSSFKIDIAKFEFINKKVIDMKIVVSIAFLNKMNIFKITIDKEKIKKFEHNETVQKIAKRLQDKLIKEYKTMHNFDKKTLKEILEVLKYFKLSDAEINVKIGTESAVLTSFLVTTISLIITFLIARKVENTKYTVLPVYINKNYLNLSIKCIISIKLVHIINIVKQFKRKDRDKEDGRSLNRRTYANSNG